jgi:NitT/TauT family transport system ATP-binding protein
MVMAVEGLGFACVHLAKTYRSRGGDVAALADVTFNVLPGEFVCLVGPSGCGKTTLLKLIAELVDPSGGSIVFSAGSDHGGQRSAVVFQEHGLFPWMNVLDNASFGLESRGLPRPEREARAMLFLERFGLGRFAHHYPHELSVGMRQRAGIARAFVSDADMLLMDEPFGALDAQTRLVLQEELLRIWSEHRKTVVYVTHDIDEAVLLGDRVLVLTGRPGRVRADIPVTLGRPRRLDPGARSEIAETTWRIWKMLEDEVRGSLQPLA